MGKKLRESLRRVGKAGQQGANGTTPVGIKGPAGVSIRRLETCPKDQSSISFYF